MVFVGSAFLHVRGACWVDRKKNPKGEGVEKSVLHVALGCLEAETEA